MKLTLLLLSFYVIIPSHVLLQRFVADGPETKTKTIRINTLYLDRGKFDCRINEFCISNKNY